MAVVKARDQVTIAIGVDVASVDIYYKLQPSTSAAPLKPTIANPSDWTTTEPTYNDGSTNTLYTCQKTTLTDGTFYWSAVSKSTAYEAAKTAWNIANNTQQNLNNLRVGGENLIIMDSTRLGRIGSTGEVYTEGNDDGIHHYCTDFIPVDPDTNYTLSWFIKITEDTKAYLYLAWYDSEKEFIARSINAIAQSNKYNVDPGHETFSSPSTAAYVIVSANRYFIIRCALKFEKGNIPTDWSPSPSDTKIVPNILRGTNQSGTIDTTYGSSDKTWADGIWVHSSGNATNGNVAEIDVDDYKDSRIKHGFRIWSTTSANKDIAQWYPPFAEGLYRLLLAVRLSPEVTQTSATLQLRIYSSSALKTYTTSITSTDWTEKTWSFWLSQPEAAAANRILIGVKGKGYLDVCAIYMKKGTFPFLPYKVYDADNWIPWAPAEEDSALYNEINSRFSQVENDILSKVDSEDVENTIVATHRIYYRTATAQSALTGPTTWVPEAESDAYNSWTTKKPPLASSVAENATKYPFLYTCEQRELLDGTIECTAVQLDDSTTVIDGGQIVTNSITAQQIAANTITTNELNTNQLTIGVDNIDDFDTTVSGAIGDAINDISIGGRNLLKGTSSIPNATNVFNKDRSCKYAYGWYTYSASSMSMSISVTSEGIKYTHDGATTRDGIVLYFVDEDICAGEEDLILSCEYRTNTSSWYNPYLLASTTPNIMEENPMTAVVSESVWQKGEWKLNFPSSEGKVIRAFLFGYINDANGWIEIKRNTLKLEKGNKATIWSPAPEDSLYDLSETIESVESRANSFCPTSFDKDDPTKWYNLSYMGSTFTKLDNGWYHYNYDNTAGESAISQYIAPTNWSLIQPGEMYTILFEIKNFSGATIADEKGLGYLQAMNGAQFYGNTAEETMGLTHSPDVTYFWSDDISEDGFLTFRLFKRADTDYIGESSVYDGMCFRYRLYATAGYVTSYDFRISIYPGKYYGDYTPYLVNSTYNKLASVDTDILGVVSDLNTEISARKATYGTCSTAAGTAAKIVVCDGFDSSAKSRILVKFTTANTTAAPTLTIQDSDGVTLLAATPVWYNNAVTAAGNPVLWGTNAVLNFVYDGDHFILDEKPPAYSIACSTGASTRAKAATYVGALVVSGTTVQVLFSTANTYVSNSVQFNLSGTGAANIYRNRAVTSTTNTLTWTANTVLTLVRYGQYWYLADNGTRTMAENAEKSATNFITEVSNDGIWITPSDAKPVSGAAAATTSGWHIADALELFRQGVNMFKVWVDSAAKMWLRLGDEDSGHILMGPDEITINNGELEAYKITASAETDEESNTRYESWLELSGAYIHSTEYADSTGNTISNQNALVADNHMGEAAVSAESWVDEHDFYWGRRGGGESEVVATGYSAVNLSGNVLVLDDQHSSGTRTYPFDMTDVIATLRSGAGTILFSGSYSTTYNSAITGLPDLTNYMRLLVEYEDSTGRRGSVWVSAEDGGTLIGTIFGCTTTGGNSASGLVIRSKSYKIALTSIDTDRDSYNRLTYGKVTVSPSNGVTYANSQEIGIVRVFGFR